MPDSRNTVSPGRLAAIRADAAKFGRLTALREELRNEPNFETQPEQNEPTCTPSQTNPSRPERPIPLADR
jgi:hypothetical protein